MSPTTPGTRHDLRDLDDKPRQLLAPVQAPQSWRGPVQDRASEAPLAVDRGAVWSNLRPGNVVQARRSHRLACVLCLLADLGRAPAGVRVVDPSGQRAEQSAKRVADVKLAFAVAAAAPQTHRNPQSLAEDRQSRRQPLKGRYRTQVCSSSFVASRRQTPQSRAQDSVNLVCFQLDMRSIRTGSEQDGNGWRERRMRAGRRAVDDRVVQGDHRGTSDRIARQDRSARRACCS